jgi:hypothetical protein
VFVGDRVGTAAHTPTVAEDTDLGTSFECVGDVVHARVRADDACDASG